MYYFYHFTAEEMRAHIYDLDYTVSHSEWQSDRAKKQILVCTLMKKSKF